MGGHNANYRNTADGQQHELEYNAGHTTANPFITIPPQQGLAEISCGEELENSLTETTFKALFRYRDDLIANQRHYSVLYTFTIDDENPDVLIRVSSEDFEVYATVWRNANKRFEIDPELSTDEEKVIPVNVTADITGPFVLEITSKEPYKTGLFTVALECDEPPQSNMTIMAYRTDQLDSPDVSFDGYVFVHHNVTAEGANMFAVIPSPLDFPYKLKHNSDAADYTWNLYSGTLNGVVVASNGVISGRSENAMPTYLLVRYDPIGYPYPSPAFAWPTLGVDSTFADWRATRTGTSSTAPTTTYPFGGIIPVFVHKLVFQSTIPSVVTGARKLNLYILMRPAVFVTGSVDDVDPGSNDVDLIDPPLNVSNATVNASVSNLPSVPWYVRNTSAGVGVYGAYISPPSLGNLSFAIVVEEDDDSPFPFTGYRLWVCQDATWNASGNLHLIWISDLKSTLLGTYVMTLYKINDDFGTFYNPSDLGMSVTEGEFVVS